MEAWSYGEVFFVEIPLRRRLRVLLLPLRDVLLLVGRSEARIHGELHP
jgi:predicted oxidoreductase